MLFITTKLSITISKVSSADESHLSVFYSRQSVAEFVGFAACVRVAVFRQVEFRTAAPSQPE